MSYDVGYGKPPRNTQFKKGASGNPKGRPKGSLNLATALNRALNERITVTENGRKRSMTKMEVAMKGMVNRALQGDGRAMQQLLGLAPLVGLETTTPGQLQEVDAMVLNAMLARLMPPAEGDA